MTANAEPIITLRPSLRRAAATVSTIAAIVAAPALAADEERVRDTAPGDLFGREEVQERGREDRETDARGEDWFPGQLPQHDL